MKWQLYMILRILGIEAIAVVLGVGLAWLWEVPLVATTLGALILVNFMTVRTWIKSGIPEGPQAQEASEL